ncbi:hypothetical protein PsorP6_010238 [Peronosclerospora sorghi]|uniref:Uncharacterized protein n=1 Tax=Peronosclerospora sorghi TaxID=230839 RepID=A0ACC0VYK7_9STRA|nr:hypothetical protein PsorP6_010238 [Peronosclerospora sorghi]
MQRTLLVFVLTLVLGSSRRSSFSAATCNVRNCVDGRRSLQSASNPAGILSMLQNSFWLATGKSLDEVKEGLGLKGLIGDALTSAPNYETFRAFALAKEEQELQSKLLADVSSHTVWVKKKLNLLAPEALRSSDEFKAYVRYATMEDDKLFTLWKQDVWVQMDKHVEPLEVEEKVKIWIDRDRPLQYVQHMLNLENLEPAEILERKYAQSYLHFLRMRKKPDIKSIWELKPHEA